MKNKLEIKYRNQKQSFEILNEEIIVDLSTAQHKLKYNIPLEDGKSTHFISKKKQNSFTLIAYFSIILNLILAIYISSKFLNLTQNVLLSIFFSTSFAFVFVLKTLFEDSNENISIPPNFFILSTLKKMLQKLMLLSN